MLSAGGQGLQADYYLYITAEQQGCDNSSAASAATTCLFDPATGRPLLGAVNVCPSALTMYDQHTLLGIILHELVHSLVSRPNQQSGAREGTHEQRVQQSVWHPI